MEAETPAAQASPQTAGQASAPETAEPATATARQGDAEQDVEQRAAAPGVEDAVMSEVAAAQPLSTTATPGGPASSPERGEPAATTAADPCSVPASAAPADAGHATALASAVLGEATVAEDDDSEPEPVDIEGAEILEPGPGIDASLVEQEALIICQARELAKACARLRGERVQGALEKAAARLARRAAKLPGGGPQDPEPLTQEERVALMAALQDAAAATSFCHSGDPVPEGVSAVERLALQAFAGVDLDLSSAAPPPPQAQPELQPQPPQAGVAQQQPGTEVLPTAPAAELGAPTGVPAVSVPAPMAAVGANGPATAPGLEGTALGTGTGLGPAAASAGGVQPGGAVGAAPALATTATEGASALTADTVANGANAGGGSAGGEGEEGINVELLIRAGPDRVRLLVGALSLLLRRCLAPARVFPVLLLGRRLGLPELEEAALLAAIVNFGPAVRAGRQAFLQLEPGPLLVIVSNSQLQVSSELEVWQAITDWVGAAPGPRRPLLYELLRAGVRLGAMDTLQLDAVQRHPLLQGGDPGPAARLVNAAYSARIISNVTRSQSQGHGAGRHHGRVSHSGGHGSGGSGGSDGGAAAGGRTSLSGSGAATASGSLGGLGQRRPHAALQQLIGGLQARAAAAKAKQLQRQQQSHSQQPRQHQPHQSGAAPQQSVGSGDSGEGRLIGNGTREGSAPPPPMPEEAAAGGGGDAQPQQPRLPGSFLPPPNRPRSPLLPSSLPHGGAGQGALAPTPTSGAAPARLGMPVSSSKSALAQMIVQAAGLSRISVGGEGGRNRLGAVQAALSGALSNPQLQEMLRKAKMGQMGGAGAGVGPGARAGGGGGPAEAPGGGLAPANAGNGLGTGNGTAAAMHLRPPPLTVPAEAGAGGMTPAASATASTGLFSPPSTGGLGMAASTSGAALRPGQTPASATGGDPGGARPPVALAPEQLLQIAAAVQKAVASGQAQPPHVQQQLANLRAFIARHLAAAPEGSPQHSMLTQLQATLAGAGQQQQQQPAPATQGSGGEGAVAPALAQESAQPLHVQPQPGRGQGARVPGVGNSGTIMVDGTAAVTVADASDGAGKGDGGRQAVDGDGGADAAAEPPAKRQRQEA